MGLYSRRKGYMGEYGCVQYLQKQSYLATRVPLSGAHLEKGDIRIEIPFTRTSTRSNDAKFLYGEVKVRHSEFKCIYALYEACFKIDHYKKIFNERGIILNNAEGHSVIISSHMQDLSFFLHNMTPEVTTITDPPKLGNTTRTITKIWNLERLLKGADFLVIKSDYKPYLFLRYIK